MVHVNSFRNIFPRIKPLRTLKVIFDIIHFTKPSMVASFGINNLVCTIFFSDFLMHTKSNVVYNTYTPVWYKQITQNVYTINALTEIFVSVVLSFGSTTSIWVSLRNAIYVMNNIGIW